MYLEKLRNWYLLKIKPDVCSEDLAYPEIFQVRAVNKITKILQIPGTGFLRLSCSFPEHI